MRKKLLTLAVAAAITAPAAALADAILYGKAHMSLDWFDINGNNPDGSQDFKGWTMNKGKEGRGTGRGNRFGLKGSEKLGGGLKAIYQIEFDIPMANERNHDLDDGEKGDTLRMRNSYVGVKGNFGTILAGRHDTPFKISTSKLDMFNDTMADYAGTLGFDDIRAANTMAYISPNYRGFQVAAATILGGGSTFGGETNRKADGLTDAYSIAATYANGPWYASAAYESHSDTTVGNSQNLNPTDYKKWRLGLGIRDLHGFYLSAIYENQESIDFMEILNSEDNDADLWQGQLGYAFGNNMVKGMYGKNSPNVGWDTDSWAIGLDHSLSKRTKTYALYTEHDEDRTGSIGDWKGFSFGMIHSF